jgi:hypothetical protein
MQSNVSRYVVILLMRLKHRKNLFMYLKSLFHNSKHRIFTVNNKNIVFAKLTAAQYILPFAREGLSALVDSKALFLYQVLLS